MQRIRNRERARRRENELADEVPGCPNAALAALIGDRVIDEQASRSQRVVRGAKILGKPRAADVLEHADADDLVETFATQFTIIAQLDPRATGNAGGGDPPLRLFALRSAQRDSERRCAPSCAARMTIAPHPQPMSSSRSPGRNRNLRKV